MMSPPRPSCLTRVDSTCSVWCMANVTVSLPEDQVEWAKAEGINLSATLRAALDEQRQTRAMQAWLDACPDEPLVGVDAILAAIDADRVEADDQVGGATAA